MKVGHKSHERCRQVPPPEVDEPKAGVPSMPEGPSPRLGIFRYGGAPAKRAESFERPRDVAGAIDQIVALIELANRYARAGKPCLAQDVLREGREALALLAAAIEGGEPALGRQGQRAQEQIRAKVRDVELSLAEATKLASSVAAVPAVTGANERKKTVLIFGLSANPPTGAKGHQGIVAWGARDARVDLPDDEHPERAEEQVPFDEVWVMPVYRHAFAEKSKLAPFDDRVALAQLCFEHIPGLEGRVRVQDTERVVVEEARAAALAAGQDPDAVRVGTIDVLRKLMAAHPDTQFVLALGGDTYRDLRAGKWKESEALSRLVPIIVLPRKGVQGVSGSEDNAPELSEISSTAVRNAVQAWRDGGPKGALARAWLDGAVTNGELDAGVLAYIIEHGTY